MTTVAWDGYTLAADKRATVGGMPYVTTKLKRLNGGPYHNAICGWAGTESIAKEVVSWLQSGAEPKEFPAVQRGSDWVPIILIHEDQCLVFEQTPFPVERDINKPTAIGSGREYAIGAMYWGANANAAVSVASKCDVYSGEGVDELSYRDRDGY
ncbi:MAG: hypothetical protein ING51_05735 [Rhodocyclaceae bacterium]|jgi:hypothetical protein|nr:hypothetical protein [Rhodocyclaceae bacterium]